jgi:hypothetical protein
MLERPSPYIRSSDYPGVYERSDLHGGGHLAPAIGAATVLPQNILRCAPLREGQRNSMEPENRMAGTSTCAATLPLPSPADRALTISARCLQARALSSSRLRSL